MLAVTVEGCLLDGGGTSGTPVKLDFLAMVLRSQVTPLEWKGQTHHQRANLFLRAWGVNMLAEQTRWS